VTVPGLELSYQSVNLTFLDVSAKSALNVESLVLLIKFSFKEFIVHASDYRIFELSDV